MRYLPFDFHSIFKWPAPAVFGKLLKMAPIHRLENALARAEGTVYQLCMPC